MNLKHDIQFKILQLEIAHEVWWRDDVGELQMHKNGIGLGFGEGFCIWVYFGCSREISHI